MLLIIRVRVPETPAVSHGDQADNRRRLSIPGSPVKNDIFVARNVQIQFETNIPTRRVGQLIENPHGKIDSSQCGRDINNRVRTNRTGRQSPKIFIFVGLRCRERIGLIGSAVGLLLRIIEQTIGPCSDSISPQLTGQTRNNTNQ